jgi:hypothetical protein
VHCNSWEPDYTKQQTFDRPTFSLWNQKYARAMSKSGQLENELFPKIIICWVRNINIALLILS